MDLSMCLSTKCPLTERCYRHANSGSLASDRQVTQGFQWSLTSGCPDFIDARTLVSKPAKVAA